MKKHAFLMTAYCCPHLINRTLDKYAPYFDIYIHIDRKSALTAADLHLSDNVTVIKELNVNWGGYNHLRAFLRLMELARQKGGYDYYHLITGQDCVVATPEMFDRLMDGKSHISYSLASDIWSAHTISQRYESYRFTDFFNHKKSFDFRCDRKLTKILNKLGIRQSPIKETMYAGNTYCSLTDEAVSYILQNGKALSKRLKYTHIPEEVYFQTLLLNSPLRDRVDGECLRLIIWREENEGKPKDLDESDYAELMSGKYLFGRKIDPVKSAELLKMLDEAGV